MSKSKTSFCPSGWQIGVAVTVSVAYVAARYFWSSRKLDRKLEKKRELCRKTLKQIEQGLREGKLSVAERDAIVSLALSALLSKLRSGKLTAEDVVKAYQGKALELNARINCVVEAITEAQEQAASCDKTGDKTRLLHGVPLSLKENIGVKGYDTTAGLQMNIDIPCKEDSVVVQVFKKHGAIPFVRTNVSQAMLSLCFSLTCSNPVFGKTINPHNIDHCPGGSSGGEGAILGGGGSIIGLGTDVGGSVRVPATWCGVCAFKPTLGRFSKRGVYSVTRGQTIIAGVVGAMAQDVDSLVLMIRVMSSPDMFELDRFLPPLPFQEQLLKSNHKLRIGYYTCDSHLPSVPVVVRAVREAKAALEALGHTVVDFTPPDFSEKVGRLCVGTVFGSDQGQTLRNAVKGDYSSEALTGLFFTRLPCWVLSLLAKIIGNKEPVLSVTLANLRKDGRTFTWFRHVEEILDYRTRFMQEWQSLGLDAVICPVAACPAPKNEHIGFLTALALNCVLYNLVNFPAGAVPVTKVTAQDVADVNNPDLYPVRTRLEGFLKKSCDTEKTVGLPVGVQCVALPFQEELCLRLMRELEAAVNYKSL